MRSSERTLLALALASVLLALDASWAWAGFYHDFQPRTHVVAAVAMISAMAFVLAYALQVIWPRTGKFVRFVVAFLVLCWAYTVVVPHFTHDPVEPVFMVPLVLAFVIGGWWSTRHLGPDTWQRVCKGIVVASLIFTISFPIIGHATSNDAHQVFSRLFLQQTPDAPANLVVVLFDETSPELAGPITAALEKDGLELQVSSIHAAGKHTVNVIPAMLSGDLFDGAMPCGIALLCSDRRTLDFTKLFVAPQHPTDVIAFFHPYCRIRGLRSCSVIPWGQVDHLASSLKQVVCDHLFAAVDCANRVSPLQEALRRGSGLPETLVPRKPAQDEWESAFNRELGAAPFWRDGGTLYLHIPLPHLPAKASTGNLAVDYRANIQEAARIADEIAVRLRSRFDRDFLMVITSDHPLRLQLACGQAEYKGPSCLAGVPDSKGMVPFIVASPQKLEPIRVTTNAGLLL